MTAHTVTSMSFHISLSPEMPMAGVACERDRLGDGGGGGCCLVGGLYS